MGERELKDGSKTVECLIRRFFYVLCFIAVIISILSLLLLSLFLSESNSLPTDSSVFLAPSMLSSSNRITESPPWSLIKVHSVMTNECLQMFQDFRVIICTTHICHCLRFILCGFFTNLKQFISPIVFFTLVHFFSFMSWNFWF